MRIVGVEVGAKDIEELIQRLTARGAPETAQRLSRAARRSTKEIALDDKDQQRLLETLDDPPTGLEELRGVLLEEHTWRRRQGL